MSSDRTGVRSKYDRRDLRRLCELLEPYVTLENTEVGDSCRLVMNCSDCTSQLSDTFINAVGVELEEFLAMFREQTTIVEEKYTPPVETVRYLKWS